MVDTVYPGALDTFTDPVDGDYMDVIDHPLQHRKANDAIAALEVKVGITGSGDATSLDAKVSALRDVPVDTVSGTTYAPVLADDGHLKRCTNAAGCLITIPLSTGVGGVAYPIGAVIASQQYAAGQVTYAGAVGVTLRSASTLTSLAQYSTIAALKIGTDEWLMLGELSLLGQRINTQAGSYTLAMIDVDSLVEIDSGGAANWTIPANATVAFPIGTRIDGAQHGAGLVTIVAGGVTVIRKLGATLKSAGQYAGWTAQKRATDEWYVWGQLAAS